MSKTRTRRSVMHQVIQAKGHASNMTSRLKCNNHKTVSGVHGEVIVRTKRTSRHGSDRSND